MTPVTASRPFRHRCLAIVAGLSVLALALSAAPASAAPEELSDSDHEELTQFFDENGVSLAVQDELFEKLERGEMWDSMSEMEPESTTRESVANVVKITSVFADGSISVEEVEKPSKPISGEIGPLGVGSCQSSSTGSGYANRYDCRASASTGIMTMGFYISYTLVQGGYDQITDVHSPFRSIKTGTATTAKLSLVKSRENSSGSAWAKAVSTYTGFAGSPSGTYEMRALVGKDTAWTRWARKGAEG
ncbi:hypothetical protein [Isoptericola croceus]|uniref:hypothetical protein n=1 Tax=Isoptericola croceus TaxID=3031406 RepID=UPI0023F7B316|nr:hypothetical protein [Isoptericola croceus]